MTQKSGLDLSWGVDKRELFLTGCKSNPSLSPLFAPDRQCSGKKVFLEATQIYQKLNTKKPNSTTDTHKFSFNKNVVNYKGISTITVTSPQRLCFYVK